MQRKVYRFLLAALLPTWFAACGGDNVDPMLPSSDTYRAWAQTTTVVLNEPIPGHGSGLRKIFINDVGAAVRSADGGAEEYPEGTIVVKEVYGSPEPPADAEPVMLTAMVKQPNHELALGGWVWIVHELPDGEESIVAEEFCLTCHSNANEEHPYGDGNVGLLFRDYLFY